MRVGGTLFDPALSAGSSLPSTLTVTAAYTLKGEEQFIRADLSGGAFTVTLPAIASVPAGVEYMFKKTETSANALTIARAGSDTIDGATSTTIAGSSRGVTRVRSNGVTWDVV